MTGARETSAGRDLPTALRELRLRAALGGVEAARRAGLSQSKVSKLENGKLRAGPEDVRTLCDVYGVPAAERESLIELATALKAESHLSRIVMTRDAAHLQRQFGRLESKATLLRSFQPAMVPGILQTRPYAGLVFGRGLPDDDRDLAIEARNERRTALDDRSKAFTIIVSEGALRWQAGDPRVMAEQLDAIITASRRPNVVVGVVAWTTAVDVFCTHAFHLYDSTAVVVGTDIASAIFDTPDDVEVYEQLFSRLEAAASTGDAARRELLRIRSDYQLLGG